MRHLLTVMALALVAAACGAADDEPNLAAASEKTQAAGSSLIAVDATTVDDGKPVSMTCSGKADYERKRLQGSCQSDAGEYELIVIGATTYMRGGGLGLGSGGSKWLKLVDDKASPGNEFSPQRLLAMLRRATRETRRVGEQEVRGIATVRYRLEVDCQQAELFDCAGTIAPVEVWIDEKGLVRRIGVEEKASSGTIDFYDFGATVVIEPPPADQVEGLDLGAHECDARFGAPIASGRALDVVRRHGFSVPGASCTGSLAVFGNTDSGSGAREREGQLHCFLYESSPPAAPTRVRRRGVDGADAELTLRNLECTILADSPTGEAKIDRLEAAFTELERAVRP